MAFSLTTNHGGSGGGASFSIGTAQNIGDLMIIGVFNFNGNGLTLTGVTDTVGTAYSWANMSGGGNSFGFIYGFLAGTGANTITPVWSGGSTNGTAYAEFTGSSVTGATLDGIIQSVTGSSTTTTTPSITTLGADDLLVHYLFANGGTVAFGAPWTTAQITGSEALAYQADVTPSTYSPNATFASGIFGSMVGAFKAAAAAAAAVLPPQRTPLGV